MRTTRYTGGYIINAFCISFISACPLFPNAFKIVAKMNENKHCLVSARMTNHLNLARKSELTGQLTIEEEI
jgi:hypothetical protein